MLRGENLIYTAIGKPAFILGCHAQITSCEVQVLASAHAVVLASGTLAPVSSLKQQLFPGVPATQLHQFSCGHVVRCTLCVTLRVNFIQPLDFLAYRCYVGC